MGLGVITWDVVMARWQPNARGRATLALFAEHGYDASYWRPACPIARADMVWRWKRSGLQF
jgi:hypothetical protein